MNEPQKNQIAKAWEKGYADGKLKLHESMIKRTCQGTIDWDRTYHHFEEVAYGVSRSNASCERSKKMLQKLEQQSSDSQTVLAILEEEVNGLRETIRASEELDVASKIRASEELDVASINKGPAEVTDAIFDVLQIEKNQIAKAWEKGYADGKLKLHESMIKRTCQGTIDWDRTYHHFEEVAYGVSMSNASCERSKKMLQKLEQQSSDSQTVLAILEEEVNGLRETIRASEELDVASTIRASEELDVASINKGLAEVTDAIFDVLQIKKDVCSEAIRRAIEYF